MAAFAVDTNCMIAAVCSWHEHHADAARAITSRLQRRERLTVPAPALVEAYAVLTRLPAPHRLSPSDAWTLLETNFVQQGDVHSLSANAYVDLIRSAAESGVAGGRTYDGVVATCAAFGRAATLLTMNPRDFEPWATDIEILDPTNAGR